ncbi:unnamed protein product [Cunninghamella echinulata]
MKKAYELSTLTGTQVLLLVVSETGLVYTFTTVKLQPIVTKPEGKSLIQACLNAPDPGMEGGGVEENDTASVGSHKTATTSSTAAQNANNDNRNSQVSPKPEATSPSVVRQQVPPPGYPQQPYPTTNQQIPAMPHHPHYQQQQQQQPQQQGYPPYGVHPQQQQQQQQPYPTHQQYNQMPYYSNQTRKN